MGMCACFCLSVHMRSGRGDIACVCRSECLEFVSVCVPVCVCPCMCALVGIITHVYARVSVWSGCVCLCPSVHYEVVGVVNTYVCASECPGVYVYLFVSVHACANGRGRNACLECVCVPVIGHQNATTYPPRVAVY